MVGARSQSVATGWWDTSVAGTSGARENSPGLKADGLGSVGGPVKSRWEGNAPTDYSRRGALPETDRRTITPLRKRNRLIVYLLTVSANTI